jgi:hypothetical protein
MNLSDRYASPMSNARERVRARFLAWAEEVKRSRIYTQDELANRLGWTGQSSFSKKVKAGPRLEDLDAVAAIMGVSVSDLVSPAEPRADAPRPSVPVFTARERQLLEWFRGLDARKQEAAIHFLPMFSAQDAPSVAPPVTRDEHQAQDRGRSDSSVPHKPVRLLRHRSAR